MDARTLAKSTKAIILASGLIAATTVLGSAQDAPIPLGTPATVAGTPTTVPLSSWYVAPPSGQALLLGHTFDLTSGNLLLFKNNDSISYTGSYANAKAVDLLLNTSNTSVVWYDQAPVGTVVLTFSDGTTLSTTLTAGVNIREWRPASSITVNAVLPTSGSAPAWTGTAQPAMGGGTAVIDMLTIAAGGKTLTGVTVHDTNTFGALKIQLSGLTVELNTPTPPPTPTPTPTCTMNDHAGKVSATKAQNVPHCVAEGKDAEKADAEKADAAEKADVAEKADAETADRAAAKSSND
jgi:hypothetical protein